MSEMRTARDRNCFRYVEWRKEKQQRKNMTSLEYNSAKCNLCAMILFGIFLHLLVFAFEFFWTIRINAFWVYICVLKCSILGEIVLVSSSFFCLVWVKFFANNLSSWIFSIVFSHSFWIQTLSIHFVGEVKAEFIVLCSIVFETNFLFCRILRNVLCYVHFSSMHHQNVNDARF